MADFTPQQREAIETIDENVVVSAGAGSGKTRVLVERFIRILREGMRGEKRGISPSEILAITFTRKAAAEMKERVRRTMRELAAAEDRLNGGFWQRQLAGLERAQITTIHGFCSRLLRENPVEAGLDPAFAIAEEFATEEFLTAAVQDFLRAELDRRTAAAELLAATYGVNSLLRQLIRLLPRLDQLAAMDLAEAYRAGSAAGEAARERLLELLDELLARQDEAGRDNKPKLALLAVRLPDVRRGLQQEPPDLRPYDAYVGVLTKKDKLKELVGAIRDTAESLLLAQADRAAIPLAAAWQQVLRGLDAFVAQRKKDSDFVGFDDLERLALQLLRDNAAVRARYAKKYRYVMVDEFQDTNERQQQLIYCLCGGAKLAGRKLFVVGDPKQSIYRFRGADVSVFARVCRDIAAAGGQSITLADNFRTVDGILEVCNEVFEKLPQLDSSAETHFEPLRANRSSAEQPRFLQVMCGKAPDKEKRRMEAEALAAEMERLHREGIPYGEMAVLLSAMTKCDYITDALQRRGIPWQVVDGKGFYERQEVLDLLNLLTALQNRCRSLELAGVLRSPYFGLNDETLTLLFLQGRHEQKCLWDVVQDNDIRRADATQRELLTRAAEILRALRHSAALLALPELWTELFRTLHIEMVLASQENGAALLANAEKLMQLACQYAASGQGTLGAWLEHVAEMRRAKARETAANLNTTGAVTIMTIHKSKGLEFNTVFLPMLDARQQTDTAAIKFHPLIGLGVKAVLADGRMAETGVLRRVKEADGELQKAERRRQLYVAMTRARDRLVMSGAFNEAGKSSADNWFNGLKNILADSGLAEMVTVPGENVPPAAAAVTETPGRKFDAAMAAAIAPLPAYAEGGRYFTASALQTWLRCPRQYYYNYVERLPEAGGDCAGSGTLPAYMTGLIVHTALECYEGDARAAWQAGVQRHACGTEAALPALALLENYLASPLFKSLPPVQYREFPFAVRLAGGLTINGVIDCAAVKDGGLLLIDYKTGRPPADGETKDGYAMQMALYKEAAKKLFRQPVVGAQLHFLQNLSRWELPDDGVWLERALELCRRLSKLGRESDFACTGAACVNCHYAYMCPRR